MAVSNQTRAHLGHDRLVGFDSVPQLIRNEWIFFKKFHWIFHKKLHDGFFGDPAEKLSMSE